MNTIPTTFDEHQITRTIIGGKPNVNPDVLNISVILLNNSGSHFKINVYKNLLECNFESIISIEHDPNNSTIDDISKKMPEIKFIIPQEETTNGELINLAMSEIKSDYVLVLKDTLYIPSKIILQNLASRLTESGVFCIVPWLSDKNNNTLPCIFSPSAEKSHFTVNSSSSVSDGVKTLYPFDNIALYNRKKFIELGGFDWTIQSNYWQNLDLAVRSWLWGEETRLTSLLHFSYIDDTPIEDHTVNMDYLRYHLKNEIAKLKMEQAYVKKSSFLNFLFQSSCGFIEAKRQFKLAKKWILRNKYRFKMDLQSFVENWNNQ